MARPEVKFGPSAELFDSIPFDLVYHDERYGSAESAVMTFHRHAELLIPEALPLDDLVRIVCRSEAERQTLMNLAGAAATPWAPKIRTVGAPLFFRRGTYLTSVQSEQHTLVVRLSRGHICGRDPLPIRVVVEECESDRTWEWQGSTQDNEVRIELSPSTQRSKTKIWLWDALAYQDNLDYTDDIPF